MARILIVVMTTLQLVSGVIVPFLRKNITKMLFLCLSVKHDQAGHDHVIRCVTA